MHTRFHASRLRGFTLLELVVTLLMLSVLVAVALPSYRAQWLASRRSEAVQALTQLQLAQESFRSRQTRYAQSMTELLLPELSPNGRFRLSVLQAAPEGFTLEAQAVGDQSRDERCQRLRLVQAQGQIQLISYGAGQTVSSGCWPQ